MDLSITYDQVARAKDGDERALNDLFARYYERVRKVVRARLGNRLRELVDSNDILQETFTSAVQAFDRFELRDEASVINWLSRIAERTITGQAAYWRTKKRDRNRVVPIRGDDSDELPIADARPGPRTAFGDREEARLVEDCLRELPDHYREVIVLRRLVGYGWQEIADEMNRPSADAARMMHAKAMLELDRLVRRRRARDVAAQCQEDGDRAAPS